MPHGHSMSGSGRAVMPQEHRISAQDFGGRVVLVTGAGKGVGKAVALALAQRGAHVIVNYFHSHDEANCTAEAVRAAGGSVELLRASVAKRDTVEEMFAAITSRHGRLDVLVNNAAHGVMRPFAEVTEPEWARVLNTGLHGSRWCAQFAAPLLAKTGGNIVNMSSIGSPLVVPDYTPLGVTKAAIESLTRYLAVEFAPLGIRVNTASASVIESTVVSAWDEPDSFADAMRQSAPLGHQLVTIDEFTSAVMFLASSAASGITGQTLLVDRGTTTGYSLGTGYRMTTPAAAGPNTVPASGTEPSPAPHDDTARGQSRSPAQSSDRQELSEQPAAPHAVAVVGMGIVVPGACDPDEFWKVLHRTEPVFSEPDDLGLADFWSADRTEPDRTYTRKSGYVTDFRPHPALAAEIANGIELPIGATWLRHTVLQALDGVTTAPGDRAVFVPAMAVDGCRHSEQTAVVEQLALAAGEHGHAVRAALAPQLPLAVADPEQVMPYRQARDAVAGVLPDDAMVLVADAACASSLYSVDIGAQRILDGSADYAVCGGMWMLTPRFSVEFAKLGALSPRADARSLDRDADGVVLSEGAAVVVLKELGRAQRDGDRVFGVLAGFGGASDGRGKSLTAPNRSGQERAIRRARAIRQVSAAEVDWIVAHATGTPLGDRTEMESVTADADGAADPVLMTSNKAIVGHTVHAAGAVSLIHALLGLEHGEVPAQQRFTSKSAAVTTVAPTITVPVSDSPLPSDRSPLVGVSAFGFGGVNAHQILARQETPLRASAAPVTEQEAVVVGWAAHLPGAPSHDEVASWLRTDSEYRWPIGFGDDYPPPPFQQVRVSSRTIAATDRTQLMTLAAVSDLLDRWGGLPAELAESTGVIVAHSEFTRHCGESALRVYRHRIEAALADLGTSAGAAVTDALRHLCDAVPATSEDTAPGTLRNVIAGRIASRFDLHGPTLAVDAGADSFSAALRLAIGYTAAGHLDLCLVAGACGNSAGWGTRFSGADSAEGVFVIAVTRQSVAAQRGYRAYARVRPAIGESRTGTEVSNPSSAQKPRFFGCDSGVELLRLIEGGSAPATAPIRIGRSHTAVIADPLHPAEPPLSPADSGPAATTTAVTTLERNRPDAESSNIDRRSSSRYRVVLRADAGWQPGDREPQPAIPRRSLVLTDDAGFARFLAPLVDRTGGRLVCTDPACDTASATVITDVTESSLDAVTDTAPFDHIRVVANCARSHRWPAPPAEQAVHLSELLFLALKNHTDLLTTLGSVGVVVADGFMGSVPTPYASLLTGPLKSFQWDQPQRRCISVVTDSVDLTSALGHLGVETGFRTPLWRGDLPTAYYRGGVRHFYRIVLDNPNIDTTEPIPDQAVIVATGGATGITFAALQTLLRGRTATVWLLGSTDIDVLPAELAALNDSEFAAHRATFIARGRAADPAHTVAELSRSYDRMQRAREIRRNIDELGSLVGSGRVQYRTCDLTDAAAVERAARAILDAAGRIDLLIHGAGIQRAGRLETKSLTGFRAVRDVKVAGYHNLKATFGAAVARWCNFGSMSGLIGLPGEADYTLANDYLGAAAAAERDVMAHDEHTVAWTVWTETGLASDQRSTTLFAKVLSHGVDTTEGQRFFLTHLGDSSAAYVAQLDRLARRTISELMPQFCEEPVDRPCSGTASLRQSGVEPRHPHGSHVEFGRFFLDRQLVRQADLAVWEHRYEAETEPYLQQHRIHGHPTVPGAFLLEAAVQAAVALVPGTRALAVRDVTLSSFARLQRDGSLTFRIAARTTGPDQVSVDIVSDVLAPDGRLLQADRRHATMTVVLGPADSAADQQIWSPWPAHEEHLVPVDHALEGLDAQLTGLFTGPRNTRIHPNGGRLTFDPTVLTRDPALPWLRTPCVLVDAMVRVPRPAPQHPGQVIYTFPTGIAEVRFLHPGNDLQLCATQLHGIEVFHDTAADTVTAIDSHGHALVQMSSMKYGSLGHFQLPINQPPNSPENSTGTAVKRA